MESKRVSTDCLKNLDIYCVFSVSRTAPPMVGFQKLAFKLIELFLSTVIFSKRRKINSFYEGKPEHTNGSSTKCTWWSHLSILPVWKELNFFMYIIPNRSALFFMWYFICLFLEAAETLSHHLFRSYFFYLSGTPEFTINIPCSIEHDIWINKYNLSITEMDAWINYNLFKTESRYKRKNHCLKNAFSEMTETWLKRKHFLCD